MNKILILFVGILLTGCVQKSFEVLPKQDINAPPKATSSYNSTNQKFGVPQNQTPLFEEKFHWKKTVPDANDKVSPPPAG